ncbi:MAG: IPT/TIG domain-containing protein [Bryobacteraceae bacterium]
MGTPVQITAPSDTLDFLLKAKTRSVTKATGIVVGPNRAGQMVIAASPLAKPGEHTVTVSATSATGEQRQTDVTVAVSAMTAVPTGSSRNPVVLLNGWETGYTNSCPISTSSADTFGNLAEYLVSDGVPVVYLFDNCLIDPNNTIEQLGNDLAAFLATIQYPNGEQVPQIDLVGFSMGGLIVRSYLAGLQPDESLDPPVTPLVGNVVLIASPNFGSFVAGNNAIGLPTGTQDAELVPGSSFLWNLASWNQHGDDMRGVNAIAIIGNAGTYTSISGAVLDNASDGLVSTTSAAIGFVTQQADVTRIVPYCQVDPVTFTNTIFGTYQCDAPGIANITSAAHPTSEIVRSFLAGTTDWQSIGTTPATDPYLATNAGTYFSLASATDSFATDLTTVTWGSVGLTAGGNATTIYYDDFVTGTGLFAVTSTSLGSYDCGTYTQAPGYFTAYRCKVDTTIESVGPLISTFPKVVSTGTITISGADFGSRCNGCTVTAIQEGATTAQNLQVNSWTTSQITAVLPASLTGLSVITVFAAPGTDAIAIVAAVPNPSIIGAAPASLAFSYTSGGSAPAAQSIAITNTGSGTLSWSATASATWLTVSPASGTAPATLTVSVSTAGLSAGTYNGTVQIAASGASNTPFSIPVTLTVTQAPPVLAIAPQALTFQYSIGGSVPAAQTVSIGNTGGGTLAWTASASTYWAVISPVSGSAPGTLTVSVNPANLAAGTYTTNVQVTAAGATGSPGSIAITLVVTGTPAAGIITAVANGGSFAPAIASATWVAIFGSNLSTSTYTWQASDFVNGALPTSLQGVSVTIDGVPAYVEYISPTQINVLAPDDATIGQVTVQVTAAKQASNSLSVAKSEFSPAFFTIESGKYVAALHLNYSLISPTSPAQPGETIVIYGTGFGATNPATPTGQLVTTPAVLANTPQLTIGGVTASVSYAGVVSPGLYQFNVTVPASLPNGDAAIVASVGGSSTQTGVAVTVQQ